MLHALGIFHEQSRADRDDYVTLNQENVVKREQMWTEISQIFNDLFCPFFYAAFLHNFAKQSLLNTTYDFEYDYTSIMHYGTHFFR